VYVRRGGPAGTTACAVGRAGADLQVRVVCDEGYSSSLAAASLQRLGLRNATDLDGGFQAWAAAGLPVVPADRSVS
jgi:rhodanese-related sulfurtransferase